MTINSLCFAGASSDVLEDFCKTGELRKDRDMLTAPKLADHTPAGLHSTPHLFELC